MDADNRIHCTVIAQALFKNAISLGKMHNGHGLTIPAIPNRGIRSLRLQNNISSTYHTLVQICASFDEISITIRMNSKKEPAISLSEIVVNAHLGENFYCPPYN